MFLGFSDNDFLLGFFFGISGSKRSGSISQGLAGDEEEDDDVVELEDDSVNDGEARHQTRPPVLVRLVLALTGMGVLKQFSGGEMEPPLLGWLSTAAESFDDFTKEEIPAEGKEAENPEKESSTK